MDQQQLESLYGPLFPHSDHRIGDLVKFHDVVDGQVHEGVIEWVQGPHQNVEGGRQYPVTYILDQVDASTGMPWQIFPSDIIA